MGIFENEGADVAITTASANVALQSPELLHEVVVAAVEQGWLLSFGSSRDGGAVSVSILNEKGKDRVWCGDTDALENALQAIYRAATGHSWSALAETPSKPSSGATEASEGKPQVKKGKTGA